MADDKFPTDTYVSSLVQLLETIEYKDTNYTREERIKQLHHSYNEAAKHFAQPHIRTALRLNEKTLEKALQTITGMVVYCWVDCSPELMAALTIHYTYTLILDDSDDEPQKTFGDHFTTNFMSKKDSHPWLRLVNDYFPNVLKHYGPFCGLNIYRSTVDFFQGCWIEQHNFRGYPHSQEYPEFLRRMNGLGHAVGASLWPRDLFDEQKYFCEITTVVAMLEHWMIWVNDLCSYYKEFDAERDQTSLINNYCEVEGLNRHEALDKLCNNVLRVSRQVKAVFKDKDPRLMQTLEKFMHGHLTWHLCDKRYRLIEVCTLAEKTEAGEKFRQFHQEAYAVGKVDPSEWAYTDDAVPAKTAGPLRRLINAVRRLFMKAA